MAAPNQQTRLNRWVALLGVTAVTVYLSWKVVEPFVEVLILGIALTVIFQPVHRRFVRWTNGNRLAAGLSTVFTILVLVVPFSFVSVTVVKEVPGAIEEVKSGWLDLRDRWEASAESGSWLGSIREKLQLDEDPFSPDMVKQYETELGTLLKRNFLPVVGGVAGFLLGFVFLIFVLFFLFRDGQKLSAKLIDFLPLPRDQALVLVKRTEEVLDACVYGVLMVAAVQGILGGITFAALGLPSPVTWGLVMTLLCTLPIVGAWIVWLPAAAYLAIHGDYTRAIILALIGQFVISSIDGLLRPILVGQRAKLHELVIFFSVLGGLKYFGLLGILLGPIVMSLAYGLTTVLWQLQPGKLENAQPSEDPV